MKTARIALLGPMGIGKTTAIRTVCGELAVNCDVPNLDLSAYNKPTTTVGVDFGEVDLGDGDAVQLHGCPGQERFDFVRRWVLSVSVGALVMTDLHATGAVLETARLLREVEEGSPHVVTTVLVARPATQQQILDFVARLGRQSPSVVPVLQADVRDKQQMLSVLDVLFSMMALKEDFE